MNNPKERSGTSRMQIDSVEGRLFKKIFFGHIYFKILILWKNWKILIFFLPISNIQLFFWKHCIKTFLSVRTINILSLARMFTISQPHIISDDDHVSYFVFPDLSCTTDHSVYVTVLWGFSVEIDTLTQKISYFHIQTLSPCQKSLWSN